MLSRRESIVAGLSCIASYLFGYKVKSPQNKTCSNSLPGCKRLPVRSDGAKAVWIVHAVYDNDREIIASVATELRALFLRQSFMKYEICNMRWNGVGFDPGKKAISATISKVFIKE